MRIFSEEHKKKLSEAHKGKIGPWSGKKRPDVSGPNNWRWVGGPRKCSCGNTISSRSKKVKVCGKCRNEMLRSHIGENHFNWKGGKPKCIDCGKKLSQYGLKRCKLCAGKLRTKENNVSWKGGITSKNQMERVKFRKQMQKLVFERDNYTCQMCGAKGDLQVDHIQSWVEYVELRFCIDNCRTLCKSCHYQITYGRPIPDKNMEWGHNLGRARIES